MIIIEKEWEATDIIDYCQKNNIDYKELSAMEIFNLDPVDFFKGAFFCNTLTVQKNLEKIGLKYLIPDTYPEIFKDFYKRKINKCSYKYIHKYIYPYFLKSVGNNKSIDGTIINDHNDFCNIWITNNIFPTPDLELYISEIIKFKTEYRILIGNNKVYGLGFQKGDKSIEADQLFINELIKVTNGNFYCIDIGFVNKINSWTIVEVNPSFSLDDYDISIEDYICYAIDFFIYIKKINNFVE